MMLAPMHKAEMGTGPLCYVSQLPFLPTRPSFVSDWGEHKGRIAFVG